MFLFYLISSIYFVSVFTQSFKPSWVICCLCHLSYFSLWMLVYKEFSMKEVILITSLWCHLTYFSVPFNSKILEMFVDTSVCFPECVCMLLVYFPSHLVFCTFIRKLYLAVSFCVVMLSTMNNHCLYYFFSS